MPAERTLPIDAGLREFTVKVGGEAVPRERQLIAASVVTAANRIASARLVYADGSAAAGSFELASSPLFAPGATVEVLAGAGGAPALLFKGIVVRQSVKVREQSGSQFVVECRHAAARLALTRRSANHLDQKDSEVIETLLGATGADTDVEATAVQHAQLVQHDISDWDFSVARALANGRLVLTRGAGLAVRAPALGASSAATLQYGATLLEFDAEIDARAQASAVQTLTWSPADQALHTLDGDEPSFTAAGSFDTDTLAGAAGSAAIARPHATLDDAEATALASAARQLARVNQVSGRAKCIGIGTVQCGDTVTLAGVGDRFNGRVLVTGVRHEMDMVQGWRTHLQFGGIELDEGLQARLVAPRAAQMLAPVAGLQVGVVTDNEDPAGEFRVRVRLPLIDPADDGIWARVASLDAGKERGMMIRPEIGDEVVLGFFDNDPRQPVLLGMLHSSAHAAPLQPSNDNPEKGFVSRSGIQLLFNDETKTLTLSTPAGNTLVLDDDAQGMRLQDQNGNKIELGPDGITIQSTKALTLKSSTESTLEAGSSAGLKAATELKLEGSSSAELSSGGTAKITGGLVQIN
jgi:Rhs element Vgr protein